jgi:hypothetical protein
VATAPPPEDVALVSVDEKSAGVLNSGARKRFGSIAQLVERLVRNESWANMPTFAHVFLNARS